jgi:hypothetical protein
LVLTPSAKNKAALQKSIFVFIIQHSNGERRELSSLSGE